MQIRKILSAIYNNLTTDLNAFKTIFITLIVALFLVGPWIILNNNFPNPFYDFMCVIGTILSVIILYLIYDRTRPTRKDS